MNYSDAIAQFIAVNADLGNVALPLNIIIAANAFDAVDPGQLDVNGATGQLRYRGALIAGPAITFPPYLNAPGFWVGSLISESDSFPFVVSSLSFPSALKSPFTYKDIKGLIGQNAVDLLDAIVELLEKRVAGSKLLPDDEVARTVKVNKAGVVCVPANTATLNNVYRSYPALPRAPIFPDGYVASGLKAWGQLVEAFDVARKAYLNKSYKAAVDSARAAAANVALWDSIYAVTEHIRDLPGTVVATVGGAVVDTLSGNFKAFLTGKVLILLGVAGVVCVGIYTARKKGISFLTGK